MWTLLETKCRRVVTFIERSAVIRLIAILAGVFGFVIVGGTAWQIWNDYIDRGEERVERAWNRLLRPSAGNTGKASALQYLWDAGQSLDGVDLSCKALGNFDASSQTCNGPLQFVDLFIKGRAEEPAFGDTEPRKLIGMSNVDFKDVKLTDAKFTRTSLQGVGFDEGSLEGAFFIECSIDSTYLNTSLKGVTFSLCELVNSSVYANGFSIAWTDISNTVFDGFDGADDQINFYGLGFAWADRPPFYSTVGATRVNYYPFDSERLKRVRLCDPPRKQDGDVIEISKRRRLVGMYGESCNVISLEDARKEFPKSYEPFVK